MKKILMTLTLALAAAIAIPAAAQNKTTTTEQTKECCKDKQGCANGCKKECSKAEGKACAKEAGKACCKDGKKGMHKAKQGKMAKGERRLDGGKGKMKMRQKGENPMMKGITLSEDQQQKVRALREKNMQDQKKSKADMKAKSKEEMQKLRADFDKEMEKILDKDQLRQYQANKAELEAKRAAKQDKQPKLEKKNK